MRFAAECGRLARGRRASRLTVMPGRKRGVNFASSTRVKAPIGELRSGGQRQSQGRESRTDFASNARFTPRRGRLDAAGETPALLRANQYANLITSKAAPCGSARTAKRPTVGISVG